jgi:hypothetical protein
MPERAEIEAAAEAIRDTYVALGTRSGLFSVGLLDERSRIRIAEVILDRVRDARGDDEGPKVTVEPGRRPFDPAKAARSPQSEDHETVVWVIPGDHRPTAADAARADVILKLNPPSARVNLLGDEAHLIRWPNVSPSRDGTVGEDHEAGIRAMLAEAEGRGLRMRTDDGAEVAAMDEADVRALAAAYLSRVSPSRDGTVAVEVVEALREAATILHGIHRGGGAGVAMVNCPRGDCRERAAILAEFGSARAGESDEGVHDAYVEPLGSGYRGFQARCWSCEWRGPEHLRGDEEMGTPESRAHKNAARADAAAHRAGESNKGGNQ